MDTAEELAARATGLLLAVADGRDGAATAYDTLLYPLVLAAVRKRGRLLAAQAQRLTGTDGFAVPVVPDCDAEWVANDVTVLALERARAAAARFDPARGDGASWALRQAAFAYVDVVRGAYGTRRSMTVTPVEDGDLEAPLAREQAGISTEELVETKAALDHALAALPDLERRAVLFVRYYGLSYAETAELLFGDAGQTRRVDKALQSARRRLATAEAAWRRA